MRNKFKKIKIGIEIECILNNDILDFIPKGDYHNGITLKDIDGKEYNDWKCEGDASINAGKIFHNYKQIEFVSMTFKSKQDFFNGIEKFINVISCNGKYELKQVMEVNKSCGCHIHLSKGKKQYLKYVHSHFLEDTRKRFFKNLMSSKLPTQIKEAIKEQYDRSYSRVLTKEELLNSRHNSNRGVEWNFCSERKGQGLEWRSFNINKVETWEQFRKLMGIAFQSLEPLFLSSIGWKKGNFYKVDIDLPEEIEEEHKIKTPKETLQELVIKTTKFINEEKLIKNMVNEKNNINKMKDEVIEMEDPIIRLLERQNVSS